MGKIKFKVFKSLKLVHFLGTGEISFEEIVENIKQVHNSPDWSIDFNTFIDLENATLSYLDNGLELYQSFIKQIDKDTTTRKWAIFTKNKMTHQSANMSHFDLQKNINIKVFETFDQALEFLDVETLYRGIVTHYRNQK